MPKVLPVELVVQANVSGAGKSTVAALQPLKAPPLNIAVIPGLLPL